MKKVFIIIGIILLIAGCDRYTENVNEKILHNGNGIENTLDEYYGSIKSFDFDTENYDNEYIERNNDFDNIGTEVNIRETENNEEVNIQFYSVDKTEGTPIYITSHNGKQIIITEIESSYERELWRYSKDENRKIEYAVTDEKNTIYEVAETDEYIFIVEASKNEGELLKTWKLIRFNEVDNVKCVIDQASNYYEPTLIPRLSTCEDKIIYMVGYKDKEEHTTHTIKLYDTKNDNLIDAITVYNVMNPYMIPVIKNNSIYYIDY